VKSPIILKIPPTGGSVKEIVDRRQMETFQHSSIERLCWCRYAAVDGAWNEFLSLRNDWLVATTTTATKRFDD